jgi:hypothetical protein
MFKRFLIFIIAFNIFFYVGNVYAKVFLYKNSNGVIYLVRDDNYAPNNNNAITIKYNRIVGSNRALDWSDFNGELAEIPINKHYVVYINKKSIAVLTYKGEYYAAPNFNIHGIAEFDHKIVNEQGVTLAHISSKYAFNSNFHDGLASVFAPNLGFINEKGKLVIPAIFRNVHKFSEGLASVETMNGKWEYINKKGIIIIPPKSFSDAFWFHDGLSLVSRGNGSNRKYGLINKNGKIVLPIRFYCDGFHEGLAAAGINSNYTKMGFINTKGLWVIPAKFKSASGFSEGLAAVETMNGKWGYINKKGIMVIPPIFEYAYRFKKGLAKVWTKDGNQAFINKNGKIILPIKINKPFRISY